MRTAKNQTTERERERETGGERERVVRWSGSRMHCHSADGKGLRKARGTERRVRWSLPSGWEWLHPLRLTPLVSAALPSPAVLRLAQSTIPTSLVSLHLYFSFAPSPFPLWPSHSCYQTIGAELPRNSWRFRGFPMPLGRCVSISACDIDCDLSPAAFL